MSDMQENEPHLPGMIEQGNAAKMLSEILDGKLRFVYSKKEEEYYRLPPAFWEILSMTDNVLILTTDVGSRDEHGSDELADHYIDILDRPDSDSDAMKLIDDNLEGFRYWEAQHHFSVTLYADGRTHAIGLNGSGMLGAFATDPFEEQ